VTAGRVTGLGEFYLSGGCFLWVVFLKITEVANILGLGEPLWLSGIVVKMRKNEIKRTRVRSPPKATFFF
jgi:hypothetical protein